MAMYDDLLMGHKKTFLRGPLYSSIGTEFQTNRKTHSWPENVLFSSRLDPVNCINPTSCRNLLHYHAVVLTEETNLQGKALLHS